MVGYQKRQACGGLIRIAWIPVLLALACNTPSRSTNATPSPTVTQTLPPPQATERASRATADARSARQTATVSTQDAGATAAAATLMSAPSSTPAPTLSSGTARPTYPPPILGGTSVGTQGVLIQSFTADAAIVNPGDMVTLQWQATGQTVTLCTVWRGGPLGECESVPASGSHEFTTRDSDRNYVMYILFAQSGDQQEQASVTVTLTCPVTWFFANPPDECPQFEASLGPGAAERYEHGLMIWNQADDVITIVYDDGVFSPKWDRSSDPWAEGMPQDDPGIVPPPGLVQPVRGFGMVWRGLGSVGSVRDRLGWATGPEFALSTAYQCNSAPKYNTCYLQGPDGVIVLEPERSAWHLYTGP